MSSNAFGAALPDMSVDELLAAEAASGRSDRFVPFETLVAGALTRGFAGDRLVAVTYGKSGDRDAVEITGLDTVQHALVDDRYTLGRQEQRGAWFLPEQASLKVGWCNLPALAAAEPRFAVNAVRDEVARVDVRACGDSLLVWALLVPLFSDLFAPIDLRTSTPKASSPDEQRQAWARLDATYADLGLDVDAQLQVMRYGGRWGQLRVPGQLEVRQALIATLATQVCHDTARRWRARSIKALAAAYYAKAKKERPLARTVLTKANQPYLAAVFAGDWLAFLDYLGEAPNEAEKVTTALPEPRLYVGRAAKVATVAAEQGLPVDEVERMLAAYLGRTAGVSPVEERAAIMRRWWEEFDRLHAAQRPGMAALWGLVDEGVLVLDNERGPDPHLYRRLLPPDLVAEIDRLWDGVTLPRWPERIVSEFHPHRQMAEAFGPAVEFWNGVALTCWFVCEGPYSRTTLGDLGDYYHRQVAGLDKMGFPVDRSLFQELERADRRLGPPEEISVRQDTQEIRPGVTIIITLGGGTRRDGFEILREIVTRHRRAWAVQHLDGYLHHRWDSELREVAREYSRRSAARGKPPTIKQFASVAASAANHWFGGDLTALFAAPGEKAAIHTERIDLLEGDPLVFVRTVYAALGGGPALPEDASWRDREAYERQWNLRRLATEALRYLQLHEALGRPPTPNEFGAERLRWNDLGELDLGWARYEAAISAARTSAPPSVPPEPGRSPVLASALGRKQPAEGREGQRTRHSLLDRLRRR